MGRQTTYTRILFLGVATLISGAVWIGSEIYHRYVTDNISPEYQAEVEPLNPQLDIEILQQLNGKQSLLIEFPPLPPLPTAVSMSPSAIGSQAETNINSGI